MSVVLHDLSDEKWFKVSTSSSTSLLLSLGLGSLIPRNFRFACFEPFYVLFQSVEPVVCIVSILKQVVDVISVFLDYLLR